MKIYDVVILGGGPAGLAAALASSENGASTLIIEREKRLGGILKQCIHDGFGLMTFKEKLSGPEYAERFIKLVSEKNIDVLKSTFVIETSKKDDLFEITVVNPQNGVHKILGKSLVLANGCRERTSKQVFINGTRPASIYTAGTAQHLVNIEGYLPCKRCVILGSGDIGLIMARRLTLEGATVVGVYEAKNTPSGLSRNISQCLKDFNIPLHLSTTITKVFGDERVTSVEIMKVDQKMQPISGTEEIIECDGVILSVGLIPENEIAEMLNIKLDNYTKGPIVDQNFMTSMEGVFSCGNALHVNDLVDYVSENGKLVGISAAQYVKHHNHRNLLPINYNKEDFLYVVPQEIDISSDNKDIILYFRSKAVRTHSKVTIKDSNTILTSKKYLNLKPPEMERLTININDISMKTPIEISMDKY